MADGFSRGLGDSFFMHCIWMVESVKIQKGEELEICDKYGLSRFTATTHVGTKYS